MSNSLLRGFSYSTWTTEALTQGWLYVCLSRETSQRHAIYLPLFAIGPLSVPFFPGVKVFPYSTGFKLTSQYAQDPWTECWPLWCLLSIHEPYTIRSDMGLWAWSILLRDSGTWHQEPMLNTSHSTSKGHSESNIEEKCKMLNVEMWLGVQKLDWWAGLVRRKKKFPVLLKSTSKMGLWGQRKWGQRVRNVLEDVAAV